MNPFLIAANVFTLASLLVHTFVGDKDLHLIRPTDRENDRFNKRLENWIMGRAGWHLVSGDLLFTTVALALINFTDFFSDPQPVLHFMWLYWAFQAVVWLLAVSLSPALKAKYLKLGQWLLLLVIAVLIYGGTD